MGATAPTRYRGLIRAMLLVVAGAVSASGACGGPAVDIQEALQVADVTTGWYDAGIFSGKNKLVPTISFRLKNVAGAPVSLVQINGVFRRLGEEDEWGNAFVRAIGTDGLEPGASTDPIVLRSTFGYTGEQPRAEMLHHQEFVDARVQIFAKHGSAQWAKLGEYRIDRQLLTY